MENKELEQKNIIISNVGMESWGFKITDEKGLKYNVSEFKKDTKEQTVAYKYLSELPKYGLGLNKCFKFVTVKNNQGGQSRYVRIVSEPEIGEQKSTFVSPAMSQTKPVIIEKETTDWDKISWGKCKHAYLVEIFKSNLQLKDITQRVTPREAEETSEQWADMSMRKLSDKENFEEFIQSGHVEDVIDVDDDMPLPKDMFN